MVHWFWASGPNNSVPFFAVFARPVLDKGLSTRPQVAKRPSAHVHNKNNLFDNKLRRYMVGQEKFTFLEARLQASKISINKGNVKTRNFIPGLRAAFRFIQSLPYTHIRTYMLTYIRAYTHTHKYIHRYKRAYKQTTWWWCTALYLFVRHNHGPPNACFGAL